jgi:hypothetical protein
VLEELPLDKIIIFLPKKDGGTNADTEIVVNLPHPDDSVGPILVSATHIRKDRRNINPISERRGCLR